MDTGGADQRGLAAKLQRHAHFAQQRLRAWLALVPVGLLAARQKLAQSARAFASRCDGSGTFASLQRRAAQTDFSQHHLYANIKKHMELSRFGFSNPFYRCHEGRIGAETVISSKRLINFASYDYLGLNEHPRVRKAAHEAILAHGTSVSASRIVAGERPFHRALEAQIAQIYSAEEAITFVSGHATNVSTIGTLMSGEDLIVYDELSHNSVVVGAKLSRATAMPFKHNDPSSLEKILMERRHLHPRALVIVEGLYSMDGDVARLREIIDVKKRHQAWLMVDEAHSLGVLGATGQGVAEHFSLDPAEVDIWMGTLSKTLAACGGYVAGKQELIAILKYQAPGLVYSVGLSPPLAASALEALRIMREEPERVARVQKNGRLFLELAQDAGLNTATSEGHAIVSIIVGDMLLAGRLSDRLLARGLNVLPIIYPAVPLKSTRFRFFITAEHTAEQIQAAVAIMADEMASAGRKQAA